MGQDAPIQRTGILNRGTSLRFWKLVDVYSYAADGLDGLRLDPHGQRTFLILGLVPCLDFGKDPTRVADVWPLNLLPIARRACRLWQLILVAVSTVGIRGVVDWGRPSGRSKSSSVWTYPCRM